MVSVGFRRRLRFFQIKMREDLSLSRVIARKLFLTHLLCDGGWGGGFQFLRVGHLARGVLEATAVC